jgi:omega-6 fatty acid desaturase (delta-12 desaturase)
MQNIYSETQINEIKRHIKTNAYATEFIEPSIYLFSTILIIFLLLFGIHLSSNYYLIFGYIILLALLQIRLFVIFHDLCHKSYFPSNERQDKKEGINIFIAQCIEWLCLFPANYWEDEHSHHHKIHGNSNEYDESRTVITSSEYEKLPKYQQILYDIFRNPFVFFTLAPLYVYWINRFVNFYLFYIIKYLLFLFVLYKIGSWKLLGAYLISQYIGGAIGMMLFHLQHQVNIGYWLPFDTTDTLSKGNADLLGASVLQIPWFLEYFTNGIEYHNIHHTDPGMPSYNIKRCYYELCEMNLLPNNTPLRIENAHGNVTLSLIKSPNIGDLKVQRCKIGYWQSFQSLFHTIFNDKTKRYE